MESSQKFDLKSFHQYINCDTCGKANPPKRCSQCRCAFYCSVECQKEDWTKNNHKKCCKIRHAAVLKETDTMVLEEQEVEHPDALNACCSICLDEPIVNPVVLKACRHAFCTICLMEWQKYQQREAISSASESCTCPICRRTVLKSTADEALEKARLYFLAGHLVKSSYDEENDPIIVKVVGNSLLHCVGSSLRKKFPRFKDERQRRLYQMAVDQLDQIIRHDPYHIGAMFVKGESLRYANPEEAIKAFKMALDIDRKGHENEKKLEALQEERPDPDTATEEEEIQYMEALNALTQSKDFQANQIGAGPYRLFSVKVFMAEANEAAGKYNNAFSIYKDLLIEILPLNPQELSKVDTMLQLLIYSGAARCYYLQKEFYFAKGFCEMILDINRHFPGNHLVLAQSQWFLGEKQAALTTLKRGILYEVPTVVQNRQRNMTCLERLSSMYSE